MIKDARELTQLQIAIDVNDACLADVLARIEPGMTEKHVARTIELYDQIDGDSPQFERLFAHLFAPYTA